MTDEMKKMNGVEAGPCDPYLDPMLQSALTEFRASVHAWSDAAYNRPRPVPASAPQSTTWRRASAWVLSLALSFGILGTAAYQSHHQQILAQHQRQIEQQRVLAEQRAQETE